MGVSARDVTALEVNVGWRWRLVGVKHIRVRLRSAREINPSFSGRSPGSWLGPTMTSGSAAPQRENCKDELSKNREFIFDASMTPVV